MTPERLAILNLIANVGLRAAIEIIEALQSAPTDAEVLARLKTIKTPDDYLAAELARRASGT